MTVILATNNEHKVREIREILGDKLGKTLTRKEAGGNHESEGKRAPF